jgi:hypothetical protein
MKKLFALMTFLFAFVASYGQAPSTTTNPLFSTNVKWVQGFAPSYSFNQASTGLTFELLGGVNFACGSLVNYPGGQVTLTANATNFVYLDTTQSCIPVVNTTGFVLATQLPLFVVQTNSTGTVAISDVRTMFSSAVSSGGSLPAGCSSPSIGAIDCSSFFQAGTIVGNTVTIGPQAAVPVSWVFNLTTPATALQSINTVAVASAFTSLNAAVSSCTFGVACTVQIDSATSLNNNLTIPATTKLVFNTPGCVTTTGFNLIINGSISAGPQQIFCGTGNVDLGSLITAAPPEWFGAKADWNGTTGTNNTAFIQTTINALQQGLVTLSQGTYMVNSTLNINKSSVGIAGVNNGSPNTAVIASPQVSGIINTSATLDTIDVTGPSVNSKIAWNTISNFNILRNVVPSGCSIVPGTSFSGPAGLSVNHAGGITVTGMHSSDSCRDFYFHDAPDFGNGLISLSTADWGNISVPMTAYTSGTSLCGFCVDSLDGEAMNTQTIAYGAAGPNSIITGVTTYGLLVAGAAINDFETDWFSGALNTYGIYVDCTGMTNIACQDNHYVNSISDGNSISAIFITGIAATAVGSVDVRGGWFDTNSPTGLDTTATIDIESSNGVKVENATIQNGSGIGIQAQNDHNIMVSNNNILTAPNVGIFVTGTTNSRFEDNGMRTLSGQTSATGMRVQDSSTGNVIVGNNFVVDAGGTGATAGMQFDATSNLNLVADNGISGYAVQLSDLGTNNSAIELNGIIIGGAGNKYTIRQFAQSNSCTAAANGSCVITVTWPHAFPNNTYEFFCFPNGVTAPGILFGAASSDTGSQTTFHDLSGASNTITQATCEAWE